MLMPNANLAAIVLVSDGLAPLALVHVWLGLQQASAARRAWLFAIPVGVACAWAALWTWQPLFVALRSLPPPRGQAGAILGLIIGLLIIFSLPPLRRLVAGLNPKPLVSFGAWRIVYGTILLILGLQGGLPAEFFWSAAIGDIAVGLWALSILTRLETVSLIELKGWNALGLIDLLHVIMLGATFFGGFYQAHPDVTRLNLLPLALVPLFVTVHVVTLWSLTRRSQPIVQSAGHA